MQAELENVWNTVGYIPGAEVKKAMDVLDKQKIKTIKFKTVEWKLIYGLGKFKYVSPITKLTNGFFLIKIISTTLFCMNEWMKTLFICTYLPTSRGHLNSIQEVKIKTPKKITLFTIDKI